LVDNFLTGLAAPYVQAPGLFLIWLELPKILTVSKHYPVTNITGRLLTRKLVFPVSIVSNKIVMTLDDTSGFYL
jgi:hypothetical protein